MVDQATREKAASLIEQFRSCQITNDEFLDGYPVSAQDEVIWLIFHELWFFYDDIRTHKLDGRYRLPNEGEALFKRCESFLRSGREYRWPPRKFINWWGFLQWIPLIWFCLRRQEREWESSGDIKAWPFLHSDEYQEELRKVAR